MGRQSSGLGLAVCYVEHVDLFDAKTAERYGWINRALSPRKLDEFVNRIAALPDGVIATKRAVPHAAPGDGFTRKTEGWMGLAFQPTVGQLKAGAQTRDGERATSKACSAK